MTYEVLGPGPLDYLPCRYGTSRLMFRGPKRNLDEPYIAFLGGTETYGKFIAKPFPTLVEDALAMPCINFGLANAGVDAYCHDPFVLTAASRARATVIQVLGAQNMTNRFYTVHPRRNDRFIAASSMLKTIFREVDFADFHFNKHMLNHLFHVSADRFYTVRQELQEAWVARMRLMLNQISGKTILLWFAGHEPDDGGPYAIDGIGQNPLFITREMMDRLAGHVTEVVEVVASPSAQGAGTLGMMHSELEAPAAAQMLGPFAHREAAEALIARLRETVT